MTTVLTSHYAYADGTLYESALEDAQSGDIASAIVKIKSILENTPDNLSARLLYAEILQQYGEFAAAQVQYERALSMDADKNLVIVPLAKVLLLQGKYSKLIEDIEPSRLPFDVRQELWLLRADAYLAIDELESAKREYRKALLGDENNITAMIGLAQVAFEQGDTALLDRYIEQAKSIEPNNSAVWFLQGNFDRRQRNLEGAIEAYSQAIAFSPELFAARKTRAAIYLDIGETTKAESDIEFMQSKIPDDPYILFLRAVLLREQGKSEQANSLLVELSNVLSLIEPEIFEQHNELLLSLIHI